MRVLLTNITFYPHKGGVENSMHHLQREATLNGDEMDIFVSNLNTPDWRSSKGIYYFKALHGFLRKPVIAPIYDLFSCYKKARQLKKNRYDLIVSRNYLTGTALSWVFPKIKHIYVIPGTVKYQDFLESNRSIFQLAHLHFMNFLQLRYMNKVSEVVTISLNMKREVESLSNFKNICRVVRIGVDGETFRPKDKTATQWVNLLMLARLVKAKGLDKAIELMSHLPEHFHLKIVGDGPLKNELQEYVDSLGLGERVAFIPRTDNPGQFYPESDGFLMFSVYEPFGQTMLESLSSGTPVIAFENTNENGIQTAASEVITDMENGLIVSSDLSDAAQKIQKYYEDKFPDLDARQRLHKDTIKRYSWFEFYKAIVNSN